MIIHEPAFRALLKRELLHVLRRPSRLIAAIATGIIFWIFLGAGLNTAFAPTDDPTPYGDFLLPGIASMVAMFGAIFAAIGLIQDRTDGYLRAAIISPSPISAIVSAKVAAAAIFSAAQALIILLGVYTLQSPPSVFGLLLGVICLLSMSATIAAIGLALAWRMDSVSGFHSIMNLVLLPMWALSGAIFPADSAAPWLKPLMYANPLTWSTSTLGWAVNVRDFPGLLMLAGTVAAPALALTLAVWSMSLTARR